MVLLIALLLIWVVPLSSDADRLRTKFYLDETQMQINDALRACRTNYTDLVTIYDKEENMTQAKMLVNGSIKCSMIGANGCTWSNGEPVTFISLTRHFKEDRCCGALTAGGTWECVNCSSRMYFMCNISKGPSFNYSLIPENKTWFEAQLYCRENHTDLVSIRSETENKQVKGAVNGNDSIWIGLQYNYRVAWFDRGQSHYNELCFTFLSKHPMESCTNNQSTCAALCYKRFVHVSQDKMSWEEALDYCKSHKKTAELLRIESKDDQLETERELERRKISGPVWVGLRQSQLFGFWIWSNGLSVGPWTNWKGGSLPEHQMSQHCGAIQKENGTFKWSDKDCRLKFRVLCEVK